MTTGHRFPLTLTIALKLVSQLYFHCLDNKCSSLAFFPLLELFSYLVMTNGQYGTYAVW
uniref:Uncharacterized protein n=1 Tax=Arundo donax TaxID=35708 RepID=A0A0A9H8M5_ARUDO